MNATLSVVTAALSLVALLGAATAQERETTASPRSQFGDDADSGTGATTATNAGSVQTPAALLAAGYEIKTVTLVPHDIVLRGGSTIDVDAVVIMLQNGPSAAQCYVTYESYVNRSYFSGAPSCAVME
jgi:hypothetical protein